MSLTPTQFRSPAYDESSSAIWDWLPLLVKLWQRPQVPAKAPTRLVLCETAAAVRAPFVRQFVDFLIGSRGAIPPEYRPHTHFLRLRFVFAKCGRQNTTLTICQQAFGSEGVFMPGRISAPKSNRGSFDCAGR